MNIHNFENLIHPTILQRGDHYYRQNKVKILKEQPNNQYELIVSGTQRYTLHIKLDLQARIIESSCDCPYDMGPICKHEVAAYYAIYDHMYKMPVTAIPASKTSELNVHQRANKHVVDQNRSQPSSNVMLANVRDVLAGLDKADMIEIIIDVMEHDRALKEKIMNTMIQKINLTELD